MIRDISYIGEGLIPAPNDGPALRYNPLHEEDVTDIAVHQWTGWLPPETWTTGEEIAYIVRIDQYHRTTRGLDGIGYHICCFPSGRVYITARLDKYGAHVGLQNNHLIGLALPGTFNLNIPSPKHLSACVEAVRFIYEFLDKEVPTTPHLNWGGTTCPGDRWREWVPQLAEEEDMGLTEDEKTWIAEMNQATNARIQKILNHLAASDPARDKWVEQQADRVIGALPQSGGGLSYSQAVKANREALKKGGG